MSTLGKIGVSIGIFIGGQIEVARRIGVEWTNEPVDVEDLTPSTT